MLVASKRGEKPIPDTGVKNKMRYKMSYMKMQNKNRLLIPIWQNMRYKMS